MVNQRIQLSSNEIYEKNFKSSFIGGYSKKDVDEFLDIIIQDYDRFKKRLDELEQENKRLKSGTEPKKSTSKPQPQPAGQQVNYDVLKRLSNLEKAVFGQKTEK